MNLKGSSFIAKDTTGLTVTGNIKVESAVNSYENESKSTSKGFMSSKNSYKNSHAEENSASNLMLGENAVILGDVNSIGSNVVFGDNTYIGGKLTTDAQQLHNSYFEENKKKGFSGKIKINGKEIKIAVRSSSSSLKTPTIDIWVSKSKHIEIRF